MTSPSVTTPTTTPAPADAQEPLDVLPYMNLWVRGALLCVAAFLTVIFGIAIYLNPYNADGTAKRYGTHQGLVLPGTDEHLPPCTFYKTTGVPCPSCGMTSSFALLIRGDVWHSVQANFAGTLLATFCLLLIPWSLASLWKQKLLFVRSFEMVMTICVGAFMALMLLRWGVVAGLRYFYGIEVWM
jgi:hypothetical protein